MKNLFTLLLILFTSIVVTSCEAIGDIFGAGVSTGVFLVLFVIVIAAVLILRVFRRK